MSEKKRLELMINHGIRSQLDYIKYETGMSLNKIVGMAIEDFLNDINHKKKPKFSGIVMECISKM